MADQTLCVNCGKPKIKHYASTTGPLAKFYCMPVSGQEFTPENPGEDVEDNI